MLETDFKSYSCLTCRQRKIKCSRHNPCSNCVEAGKQCSFVPPVRGKRKRTKSPKEGLHAKLKRYEDLLRSYGAKIDEPSDQDESSDLDTQGDLDMAERTVCTKSKSEIEEIGQKYVTKDGSSRYLDDSVWPNLGDEPHHPEDFIVTYSADDESDLFLGTPPESSGPYSSIQDFQRLHPPIPILSKLWEIYVDRANPLMRLLHLPTFWTSLKNAVHHPQTISQSLMAAIFAFYLISISSLDEDECQTLLGIPKATAFTRYKFAARQSLVNAGFLHTSSLMTLRAFVMFIMAIRSTHRSDTLFSMTGVALRLARKMGLHRDGTSLGLSPFETEERRRLWWHILHVDFRLSEVLGTKPSLDLLPGDTKIPLNITDEDLTVDMVYPPSERKGTTSMIICLIGQEITGFLRQHSSVNDVCLELFISSAFTLAEKDSLINQIEDLLERKYLRYCDPLNSLDQFAIIIARSAICKMKLMAHSPGRLAKQGIKISQSERDLLFTNARKMLEYINLVKGNPILDKFKWQLGPNHLFSTILYVLVEARDRKIGPEVDKLWQLIGEVFSRYHQIFEETTSAIYATMGKLTLKIWDDYLAAMNFEGLPEPPTPEYISAIRRCRVPSVEFSFKSTESTESRPHSINSNAYDTTQALGQENIFSSFDAFASYDFSDLLSLDMDTNEWARWV